jgi:hypothetical protein
MTISPAQRKALRFLNDRNGEGVIDRYGRLMCAGEVGKFMPDTWLRLMTAGLVKAAGRNRLRITPKGKSESIG